MSHLTIPINSEDIRSLKVGESVMLSGIMLTGRDAVHKWMMETFIKKIRQPQGDDSVVYEAIKPILHSRRTLSGRGNAAFQLTRRNR